MKEGNFNNNERFKENYDSKRMELQLEIEAVAIYNEIEGRGTKSGGVFLDISYKERNLC